MPRRTGCGTAVAVAARHRAVDRAVDRLVELVRLAVLRLERVVARGCRDRAPRAQPASAAASPISDARDSAPAVLPRRLLSGLRRGMPPLRVAQSDRGLEGRAGYPMDRRGRPLASFEAATEQTSASSELAGVEVGDRQERVVERVSSASCFRVTGAVPDAASVSPRPSKKYWTGTPRKFGEQVEASRADAVRALLVLLDLAEGQAEVAAEPSLADPERLAALPHSLTNMGVDLGWP